MVAAGVGGMGVLVGVSVASTTVGEGATVGSAGVAVGASVGAKSAVRVRSGVGLTTVPPINGRLHADRIKEKLRNKIKTGIFFIPTSIVNSSYPLIRCTFQAR